MQLQHSTCMLHEPIIATVSISNNSGRDIMLADTEKGGPWFTFQVTDSDGRIVPPRSNKIELAPLEIHQGETVKRTVNLHELYFIDHYGPYRMKASVYFEPMGQFFSSKLMQIQVTEGSALWKQTVGVPEGADNGDDFRTFSLLTMEHEKSRDLYVRVQSQDGGVSYGCYNLGRTVDDFRPDVKFDSGNNLWVLQHVGEKNYLLSRIGANGDFQGQSTYVTPKTVPRLRKLPNGQLQILGAYQVDKVPDSVAESAPKLSDRPAGLPGSTTARK